MNNTKSPRPRVHVTYVVDDRGKVKRSFVPVPAKLPRPHDLELRRYYEQLNDAAVRFVMRKVSGGAR